MGTRALRRDAGAMKSITRTQVFRAAVGLIALHVADDNFFQPPAGTSAADHLVSGLVPLALLALAFWVFPRLSGGRQGALALFLGPIGIAIGIEAIHYANQVGASGDDFTGFLTIPAGLSCWDSGPLTLWRTRRTGATASGDTDGAGSSRSRARSWRTCSSSPSGSRT